ncbi:branched-chain amino acid transport system ATP-binding protein [Azospirillum fermentarium]|uniref:ABC transporter ATP-binding protein n=1 Tax=Azospirillum fermentarium TaxID=1233114 RepID=UPI0022267FC2|nr:ABC transporter ATP-binding protein [Azospirillum fermentarium]MCW2248613.1 branched-chain amino acid transport system ATP-binding protein [Azospirillum fermentarium]
MTTEILLDVRNLSVAYGKVEAVSKVSLSVPRGSIVTVIGPNGAGKTTTLSAIMGLRPSSGHIAIDGTVEAVPEVERMVVRGLNLVPEKRELFGSMTIEDNLLLGAFQRHRQGHRDQRQTMEEVYALFPRLKERRTQAAGTLSGGERQMLAVGRALMAKPTLLMLDEPSLGLAPLIVREIFRIVAELRRRGVSILLVEQNARAALQVADYAYVLENGAVKIHGPAQDLANDPRIIESYLGLASKHQERLSA